MDNEHSNLSNEKKTLIVILCTIIAMTAEIYFGYITKSMALLAEGYHMVTHILTLGLTYAAYIIARKFEGTEKFPSGTYKISTLAAYTSAMLLGFAAFWIVVESVQRFLKPEAVDFNDAVLVAAVCFIVNGICLFVMKDHHHHLRLHHAEEHTHSHDAKEDYNYKAAYYHIAADLLTSVVTIIVLILGKMYNCIHLDAVVGILCGVLIFRWALILLKHTVKILVDMK